MKKRRKSGLATRSFDEWEDQEASRDLKRRIDRIRQEELEELDDYAEFDPTSLYERDETIDDDSE